MPEISAETEAPAPVAVANGLDAAADLAETRTRLRRRVDKAELRLAVHDIAEGLRGMIRVAPFAAIASAVAVGLMLGRRRRPRRPPPRRA